MTARGVALAIAEPLSTSVSASIVVIVAVPGRRAVSTGSHRTWSRRLKRSSTRTNAGPNAAHRAKFPIACAMLNGSDSVAIAM